MTDRDIIERVAAIFQRAVIASQSRNGYKPTYSTRVRGYEAVQWMKRLTPLMGARRQNSIRSAIDSYSVVRRGRMTSNEVERMVELRKTGQAVEVIASEYGIRRESVYRILRRQDC